jgi:CubicO group peptidase (beta-lactamase class C family)
MSSSVAGPPRESCVPPRLGEYLRAFMQQRRVPGMQVGIVRGGEIVLLEAFGLADIEHCVPVTVESVFPLASITKAFTGVALMQLVEDGLLDLDAPVSRYLERLPPSWQAITARQLAGCISGLPDIVAMDNGTLGLIGASGEPDEAWAAVQTLPLECAPGGCYRYIQTNFAILGKIIDRLAGVPFTRVVERRQLAVAGMSYTMFADDRDVVPNRVTTYALPFGRSGPVRDSTETLQKTFIEWPAMLYAAAGLNSTALDICRWLVCLQRVELLEKQSSLVGLWTPAMLNNGAVSPWAVGWPVLRGAGSLACTPGGSLQTQIAFYPEAQLGVVILTNLQGAIPEQMRLLSGTSVDMTFINQVAELFVSR